MPYAPLYEKLSEVAEKETRSILINASTRKFLPNPTEYKDLPDGNYSLIEAYCNDEDCDCRRVFFNVVSDFNQRPLAVVTYGWESRKYYEKWMGDTDESIISTLYGTSLNLASSQSLFAEKLLKLITEVVLTDPNYVERIKNHYKMFRKKVDEEYTKKPLRIAPKPSRNEICTCGSGKKYKKCCGFN
jgi:hypothetical protein